MGLNGFLQSGQTLPCSSLLQSQRVLAIGMAAMVVVGSVVMGAQPAQALSLKDRKQTKAQHTAAQESARPVFAEWPTRNFLPPVATINPKLPDSADEANAAASEDSLEVVSLSAVTTPVLTAKPSVERLDSKVDVLTDTAKQLQEAQAKLEETDLEALWSATVERNPVIRFSLEKLATPEELAQKQSSVFMRKTLGVLISGATLATTMLPGGSAIGSYRNMGIMAGGDALKNMASGRTKPIESRLTATEKIQLAGMIDDLQRQVIQAYHDYRRSLVALADADSKLTVANERYALAMAQVKDASGKGSHRSETLQSMQAALLMSNGSAYYQAKRYQTRLKQEAKRHRLQLERLAGVETVSGLKLAIGSDTIAAQSTNKTASATVLPEGQ